VIRVSVDDLAARAVDAVVRPADASLDLLGLGREKRAVGRHGRAGKRSLRERVSPLEQLLRGRPGPSAGRFGGGSRAASGRRRIGG